MTDYLSSYPMFHSAHAQPANNAPQHLIHHNHHQPQQHQSQSQSAAFQFSSAPSAAATPLSSSMQQHAKHHSFQHTARNLQQTPMHTQGHSQQQSQQAYNAAAATPFHRGVSMQALAMPMQQQPQPNLMLQSHHQSSHVSVAPPSFSSSSSPSPSGNTAHSSLLYQYLLPLEVHAAGKDRCRASMILSVSSSLSASAGLTVRSIQLQCHQESDPYFLYFAQVTEHEYPRLKQSQNLNVDFTNLAAEIEGQISKVDGARRLGAANSGMEIAQAQAQQEIGSPAAQSQHPSQQFDYNHYQPSHLHDAHNSSTLSLATGSGSGGSGLSVRDDMMSAQFLMHSSASAAALDGSAEFKLIYRHNFRMMDILSLGFTRASEAQLKKFMVEGWGAEKAARMQAEAEIQKLKQSQQQLEISLEETRNQLLTHSHSSDSQASSLRLACEQEVMESRERHAQAVASLRASHESELSALSKEWESKLTSLQSKFDALAAENNKVMVDKAALHTKLSTLTVEHEHAQHELTALRAERTALRQSLNAAEAALSQSQSEVNKSSIRLAQLEAIVDEKSSVVSLLQSSATSETQKHSMLSEALAQSKREVAHLTSKYSAVCTELARGNDALSKLQAKLKAAKEKSAKAKELQLQLEERLSAQEISLKDATHKSSAAVQEKQFVESERDRLLAELKAAQRAIADAQEQGDKQDKMITYLNEQITKTQMSKMSFTSAMIGGTNSSNPISSGGLRALDAGLTRPSFNSALATPMPLPSASDYNNHSPSPGAAPVNHQQQQSNVGHQSSHVPSLLSSSTLSKSTRALLANKENAYSAGALFSPAPTQTQMQQQQQHSQQNTSRLPLSASIRPSHNLAYGNSATAGGMHKLPSYSGMQSAAHASHNDLSYYAPATAQV